MSAHVACTSQFMLLQFLASWLHIKKHAKLAHEQRYKNRNMQDWFRTEREEKKKQFAKTCKTWTGREKRKLRKQRFHNMQITKPRLFMQIRKAHYPKPNTTYHNHQFLPWALSLNGNISSGYLQITKIQGSNKSGSCATRHLQWTKISLSTCTAASNSSVSFARNTPRELLC